MLEGKDKRLWYKVIGDVSDESKENIVFIHGAGGSSVMFFKQLRLLRKDYNLILLDLRGHGKSKDYEFNIGDDFQTLAEDIMKIIDDLSIKSYHVISLSLGTLVNLALASLDKRLIDSILIGATVKLNKETKLLLNTVYKVRNIIPYKMLYKNCARIILPKHSHKESRKLFIQEFKKVSKVSFINWLSLIVDIDDKLKQLREEFSYNECKGLFISGDEDYLFKKGVKDFVYGSGKDSLMDYIELDDTSHVCNIDNSDDTNSVILNYLKK